MKRPRILHRFVSPVAMGSLARLVLLLSFRALMAAEPTMTGPAQPSLIASPEPGWPQWRGPRRDGICDETGLLPSWPDGGPMLLWKTNGLGRGYSCPIITGGRIYLTGDFPGGLRLFALDLKGQRVWEATNGLPWKGPYPGSRACVAVRDGRVFHMNAHGRVACFDAVTGRELWAVNMLKRFEGRNLTWAVSECLLVDGPRVIVTAGGRQALMAALDVRNGQTVWTTEPLIANRSDSSAQTGGDEAVGEIESTSYASPILVQLGGRRQIVGCSLRHLFGVDADTGHLLWTRPLRTRFEVIAATPVLIGDAVFGTAPDTDDAKLYRIRPALSGVALEELWTTRLDTCHGGLVFVDGSLYGSWYRRHKGWACVDARTGAVRYETNALAKGSVLYADGRLYCLSEEGEMAFIKPGLTGFEFVGRFRLVAEKRAMSGPIR